MAVPPWDKKRLARPQLQERKRTFAAGLNPEIPAPAGCVCPVGAEQTCENPDCPRKAHAGD